MYPVEFRREALDLVDDGLSLNTVSKRLGVSRAALREWRDLPSLRGRGLSPCPRACSGDETLKLGADYAALFGFYLGDGCLSAARTHFVLRVSCDATYPGIIADITSRIEAVHPGAGVCHVPAPGVIVVQNCWKHWPCLFPQHGPGRKHDRVLGMEPWQWAIVELQRRASRDDPCGWAGPRRSVKARRGGEPASRHGKPSDEGAGPGARSRTSTSTPWTSSTCRGGSPATARSRSPRAPGWPSSTSSSGRRRERPPSRARPSSRAWAPRPR